MLNDAGLIAIGHFDRAQDRNPRLIAGPVHAPIPGHPARRTLVEILLAAVILSTKMIFLERPRRLQIFESRNGPGSRLIELFPSELHGEVVGGREGTVRIVARSATQFSRTRQGLLKKK